jgi:uncharacterized protein (DUF608 family)
MMGTLDQRLVGGFAAEMFFPNLSGAELNLFLNGQIGEESSVRYGTHWDVLNGTFTKQIDRLGAVYHDVGWGDLDGGWEGSEEWLSLHWPDLPLCYILQQYRHIAEYGGAEALNRLYESLASAYRFYKTLDRDGDGIPELWGFGSCTFDHDPFVYFGLSPYIITLQLAASAALKELAVLRGDYATEAELKDGFEKAARALEGIRSNGGYLCWKDTHHANWEGIRSHPIESSLCHTAQLAGIWARKSLRLDSVFDDTRAADVLMTVYRNNVAPFDGCPAIETAEGLDKYIAWPTHTEAFFSSCAIYYGLTDIGLEASYKNYRVIYERFKTQWNQPLSWVTDKNGIIARGIFKRYMSSPSSLHVLAALNGAFYNTLNGTLDLSPRAPEAGKEEAECILPVFLPLLRGTVIFTATRILLNISKLKNSELPVSSLTIHGARLDGLNLVLRENTALCCVMEDDAWRAEIIVP